jgi:hypothetical protein
MSFRQSEVWSAGHVSSNVRCKPSFLSSTSKVPARLITVKGVMRRRSLN